MSGSGEHHRITGRWIDKYAAVAGREAREFQNPATRVAFIKSLGPDQFLDLLTVTNSNLRGEGPRRWKNLTEQRTGVIVVTNEHQLNSPDLEGLDDPETALLECYKDMQENVTEDTIGLYASKLYTAIIFTHVFSDGNGRLARNMFSLVKNGKLLEEEQSSTRGITDAYSERINGTTVTELLHENQIGLEQEYLAGNRIYLASEDPNFTGKNYLTGKTSQLKFLAAKKAGILTVRAKELGIPEEDIIACYANGTVVTRESVDQGGIQDPTYVWKPEEIEAFRMEYAAVKVDWFHKAQELITEDGSWEMMLTIGTEVPNPLGGKIFLEMNELVALLVAVRSEDNELLEIIKSRTQLGDDETVGEQYIANVKAILSSDKRLDELLGEYGEGYVEAVKETWREEDAENERLAKLPKHTWTPQ